MRMRAVDLREELEARRPGIVCLVGGGGKTSLLFALGTALARAGRRVLCTTTTRLRRPDADTPLPIAVEADPDKLAVPAAGGLLAFRPAPPEGDPGKAYGYPPEALDALARRDPGAWILVEADGAAGRPLKAPAEHEPVVPSLTGVVIGVIGLGGVYKPFGPDVVFRPERAAAIAGLETGQAVTPRALLSIITHPAGLFKACPAGAARLLFCNQSDLPGATRAGEELADAALPAFSDFFRAFYIGSVRREGLRCLAATSE